MGGRGSRSTRVLRS